MRAPTPNQWKYQSLAKSLAERFRCDQDFLEELLLHAFDKVYVMGQTDSTTANEHIATGVEIGFHIARPAVSVIDFSDILPEVFEHIKHRWRNGLCH